MQHDIHAVEPTSGTATPSGGRPNEAALAADASRRAPSTLRDDEFSWRAATAASVALAREYVRGMLSERDMEPEAVDDAILLTSELVTNVVEHTGSAIVGVAVNVTPSRVQVTVRGSDTSTHPPRPDAPTPAGPSDAHGRGLMIVDAVADDWGVGELAGTSETWFALDAEPARRTITPNATPAIDAVPAPEPAGPRLLQRMSGGLRDAIGGRRSLRRRIAALVVTVLVVVLVGGITFGLLIVNTNAATERRTALGRALLHGQVLQNTVLDQETALRGYLLSRDPSSIAPWSAAERAWPVAYDGVTDDLALLPQDSDARADIATVGRLYRSWMRTVAVPEIAQANHDLAAAQRTEANGPGRALLEGIRAHLTGYLALTQRTRAAELTHEDYLRAWTGGIGAAFGAALLLVVLGIAVAARRMIVNPVRDLSAAARAVAAGRRDHPVRVSGPQEIVAVAEDVEAMRAELLDRIREQEHLIVGLQQHSPTVASLRAALGTVPINLPRLAVAARTLAGDGVLSGDWYDVIRLPDGKVAITLGDVAGHGPASAVTALAVKHALAAVLVAGRSPDEAMASATAVVTSTGIPTPGLASVFIAILDPRNDSLVYANAGHPAAFVWNPFSYEMQQLSATGPILSRLTADSTRRTRHCSFGPDAVLAVYSDGLTEASPSGSRDEFGDTRLYETLGRLFPQHDPAGFLDDHAQLERILTASFTAVADHARVITDDATLLVARHVASDALRGGPSVGHGRSSLDFAR